MCPLPPSTGQMVSNAGSWITALSLVTYTLVSTVGQPVSIPQGTGPSLWFASTCWLAWWPTAGWSAWHPGRLAAQAVGADALAPKTGTMPSIATDATTTASCLLDAIPATPLGMKLPQNLTESIFDVNLKISAEEAGLTGRGEREGV